MPLDPAAPDHAPYGQLPEGGTVRPIVRWGTPVMHRRSAPVTAYDDDLRALVADMVGDDVRRRRRRAGRLPDRGRPGDVRLRLPRRVRRADGGRRLQPGGHPARGPGPEARRGRRGLPVAAGRATCRWPARTSPRWTGPGLDGEPVQFSGDGLLARCLQHETDHTRGTVFGDRLSTRWRKKLQKAHEKTAEHYPGRLAGRPP